MQPLKVFYSWQSDITAAANRTLILKALEDAAREIAADGSIGIEPVIDRDTSNIPGSPDIGATILAKIGAADVMVADVTIVNSGDSGRHMPNPNVMMEIGYALAMLSDSRLILIQNTAFGGPESLPFDLRQKRVIQYASEETAAERAPVRRELQGKLRQALQLIATQVGPRALAKTSLKLKLSYKTSTQTEDRRDYRLRVSVYNSSETRIEKWHVDVVLPKKVVPPDEARRAVKDQSTKERLLFRFDEKTNGSFYAQDGKVLQVHYFMDHDLFYEHSAVLKETVVIRCYANDQLADTIERPFGELQQF